LSRKLTRDARNGMLTGVAAGFGRYLEVDPVLVRLGFVLLTFAHGLGLLLYFAGWALMPRSDALPADPSPEPVAAASGFDSLRDAGHELASEVRKATAEPASAQLAIGSLLVVTGALLLAHNFGLLYWPYWMRFETLWPLVLVALGLGLVAKSRGTL
jgi:phage shock protein PspC (stress-responsive transcriptional regulator)